MKNLFKNRKTRRRNLLLVIAPFLIAILVFGFIIYRSAKGLAGNAAGSSDAVVYKSSIDSMDYHLRSNATDLQVELFHELTDRVKDGTDKAAIAQSVAENYVADFYTWTNKAGTYDVGGMYYVYSPQKKTIFSQARNTFYKYVTYYINTIGSEKLIEVTSVDSTVDPVSGTYEVDGKVFDSYFVIVNWDYKNEDMFNGIEISSNAPLENGERAKLENKMYFTVIENKEGRFEIVQAYGDF